MRKFGGRGIHPPPIEVGVFCHIMIKTESEQEPEPIAVSPVSESSSAPEPQIDIMAKLKELSQMYQAGLLTDEEFTAAKRAVLSL